jgi:hypothetical protein
MPAMRPRCGSHAGCYSATSWLIGWEELQNPDPKSAINRKTGAVDYVRVHRYMVTWQLAVVAAHELAA